MRWIAPPQPQASLAALAVLYLAATGAGASSLTTAEATSLLERVHTIDLKCQVLSATDRDELAQHLSRAQFVLAEQTSLKQAQAAIAVGKAAAAGSVCSADDKALVVSTLALARKAREAAVEQRQPIVLPNAREPLAIRSEVPPPPEVPQAKAEPLQKIKPAIAKVSVRKKKVVEQKVAATGKAKSGAAPSKQQKSPSLTQYASLAQRYYKELKCRNLSFPDLLRLYAKVLSAHQSAVASNKRSAVRAVLRSAKAKAEASRCK